VGLEATASSEGLALGTQFELQIDAFVGERQVIHFEVARRSDDGDLVRLLDDSTVTLRGLNRDLWSTQPSAWCEQ
jgi:hypothetical protein